MNKIVKTEFLWTDIDWKSVKNICRFTVNKEGTDNEPSSDFKTKLLIAEHSPIRTLRFRFQWKGIASWVCTHFVRHFVGWIPFVSTQRSDRTGLYRDKLPQDSPVTLTVDANAQAAINVARKRLCYQCSPETRMQEEDLKESLHDISPEIADALVPNCVYRGGCPEPEMCEECFWVKFLAFCNKENKPISTIRDRYKAYNEFYLIHKYSEE